MRAVVQRVSRAAVWERHSCRESEPVAPLRAQLPRRTLLGQIGRGLLILLGIGKGDTETDVDWMINKLLNLRIFPDDADKMNRSVTDISGGILVVSQFTLYGDARKGTRPSFSDAMPPAEAEKFYNEFMTKLRKSTSLIVAEGRFAAMMDVELVNDGPVTIILESKVGQASRLSNPPLTEGTGETPVLLFAPFDPETPVHITARHLPHWQQTGSTYFVTVRLADSLPQQKLQRWRSEQEQWLKQHPPPHDGADRAEYQERFTEQVHRWLDAGYGECWLRRPEVAETVERALRHFDGERYRLADFVIMPNHVHVLVTPLGEQDLADMFHAWKSYSAHQINRMLQRTGKVWQDESFDHLVRDEHSLQQFAAYIRQNPIKAGLHEGEYKAGQASRLSHPPDKRQDRRDARPT